MAPTVQTMPGAKERKISVTGHIGIRSVSG